MLCKHCGFEAGDTAEFCEACGASLHADVPDDAPRVEVDWALLLDPEPEETPQPEVVTSPDEMQPTAGVRTGFLKRRWKILVPTVLVLMAVTAATALALWSSPKMLLGRALAGLSAEIGTRVDATPLRAFGILADCLKNGQIAVETVFSLGGKNLDFDIAVNKERLAMHSSLLGEEYYGFRYDTAREEVEHVLSLLGVDGLRAEVWNALDSIREVGASDTAYFERYTKLFLDFSSGLKPTSRKVDAVVGDLTERCTAIEYHAAGETLTRLYLDYVTLLETDGQMRAQYEFSRSIGAYGSINGGVSYDEWIAELRRVLDELPEDFAAGVTAAFLIDGRGRLVTLIVRATATTDGETVEANAGLNCGASVTDPWVLALSTEASGTMIARWTYEEREGSVQNRMELRSSGEVVALGSTWRQEDGSFTLMYDDGYDAWSLTGMLTSGNDGFDLALDEIDTGDFGVTIDISARRSAQAGDPAYIGLSTLGQDFVGKLQMAVLMFLLS